MGFRAEWPHPGGLITQEEAMTTLHVENTVRDYDEWKSVFDKFDRFRADNQVRSYRVSRFADDPSKVHVDLEFDTRQDAEAFTLKLQQIWATPQSQAQLVAHNEPILLETLEHRTL
jgi:hypothetical protein